MNKQIAATIPAKTIKLSGGKSRQVPARTEVLTQDDAGVWSICGYNITEAEAIDVLRNASNWDAIRREHFPMYGFHA